MKNRARLPLAAMAALLGCSPEVDVVDTKRDGFLALNIVLGEGVESRRIDQGRVTIEGPTNRTVNIAPGATQTISGLVPGTYTVVLEGLTSGEIETFGEVSGVVVTAGANTPVTITASSFVPVLATLPSLVEVGQDLVVQFSTVSGAASYTVEWANNPAFTNLQSTTTSNTTVNVRAAAVGNLYVRVRARNRLGSNGRAVTAGPVSVPTPAIPTDQRFLAAGGAFACALDRGGQAYCWGSNAVGQLGNGSNDASLEPAAVAGGRSYVSVTAQANGSHTCALDRSGRAFCWGAGTAGQLGNAAQNDSNTPVEVAGSLTLVSISAGNSHTCGVTAQGQAYCWGANAAGSLGDGTTTLRSSPTPVQTTVAFRSVAGGSDFTCGLAMTNEVWCWGSNNIGQMGDGIATAPRLTPVRVANVPPAVGVTAGSFHACAWTAAGTAYCWGRGANGRLGDGDLTGTPKTPRQVLQVSNFARLSAANGYVCGATSARQAYCWGLGRDGRLGNNDETDSAVPAAVIGLSGAVEIAGGGNHTCALTATGEAYCWGLWSTGALGIGKSNVQLTPGVVSGGTQFTSITAGVNHTCGLAAAPAGSLFCWGFNATGQLGTADTINRNTAVRVLGIPPLQIVSAGGAHTCGTTSNFTAYCWGFNGVGQLGNGSQTSSSTPVQVFGAPNFVFVSAGGNHSCALSNNPPGLVSCWGSNAFGQLGDGTTNARPVPGTISGLPAIKGISAGNNHSCAVAVDGRAFCWGSNNLGQLGNGATANENRPAQVVSLPAVMAISAGSTHTCALDPAGMAYCWGGAILGNGTTGSSVIPVAVSGSLNFNAIRAGSGMTCAVATDGRGYCWGSGSSGELGTGASSATQLTPAEVTGGLRFVLAPSNGVLTGATIQHGSSHACGLATDLRIHCWGLKDFGALGNGEFPRELTPARVRGATVFRSQ